MPQARPRTPFPLIGAAAPVVMSVAMWLVTGSVLALMFAALGPAIAIANLVDSRMHGARAAKRELARFDREVAEAMRDIDEAHRAEREFRLARAPSVATLFSSSVAVAVQWGRGDGGEALVNLGAAVGESSVELDGTRPDRSDDPVNERLRELNQQAATLKDDPVIVSARGGIAVIGATATAAALVRTILVQLAAAFEPTGIAAIAHSQSWLGHLGGPMDAVEKNSRGRSLVTMIDGCAIESAAELGEVSSSAHVVVRVHGDSAVIVRAPGLLKPLEFRPEFTSEAQAEQWVFRAATFLSASDEGAAGEVPTSVDFDPAAALAELLAPLGAKGTLACHIGNDGIGPCEIDLVAMGPHAVIGGTTGSGKSEMLVTWILAMAARYSPSRVTFLLFDFKGGSSFGDIAQLPHTVGLVTDLDGRGARRAISSLAAELRHRERVLAEARVRHVDELDAESSIPRLVVVVDEFAAMATDFPELHAEFGDLAARGRSLGVHLVLCTQRPAGVVRDALLANTNLRLSLRVNNSADSVAVIGTAQASAPALPPGRVLIATDTGIRAAQVARASSEDVAAVERHWARQLPECGWSPRRPWLEPLPEQLAQDSLPPGAFALNDLPEHQRQDPVEYLPHAEGNLLVIGAARSGKTTALASLASAQGAARVLGADIELCWDALAERTDELLLLDDLDLLVSLYGAEHQAAFLERLSTVMRRGERRVVIAAERWSGSVQSLATLCGSRLLLRMPTKHDHIMVGGELSTFESRLAPGAGWFNGVRVQVALPTGGGADREANRMGSSADVVLRPIETPTLVVVSNRPGETAKAVRVAGWEHLEMLGIAPPQQGVVIIGDPETWQCHWPQFTALARERPVVFDACSLSEVRVLTRTRELPPPLANQESSSWVLFPGGEFRRARFHQPMIP